LLPTKPGPIRIDRFLDKKFKGVRTIWETLDPGVLGYTEFGPSGVTAFHIAPATGDLLLQEDRRINAALWGTYRDAKAIAQFKRLFPQPLNSVADQREWKFKEGLDLRNIVEERKKGDEAEELEYVKELENLKLLNVESMSGGFYMTVPPDALAPIAKNDRYVRKRGGKAGLAVARAPHLFWSITSAAYSDLDFVLPNPQVALSAPRGDADYLRALSAYLNSSFGQYLLFFECASWGNDRSKFAKNDAAPVHIPNFSDQQITELASLHRQLADLHAQDPQGSLFKEGDEKKKVLAPEIRVRLTNEVAKNSENT